MNLITHFVRPNFSVGKTELNSNIMFNKLKEIKDDTYI